MSEFLKVSAIVVLGIISLIIAIPLFFFILPFIIVAAVGLLLLSIIFIVLWLIIYAILIVGAIIVHWFKPAEVKKGGSFTLDQAKEDEKKKGETKGSPKKK